MMARMTAPLFPPPLLRALPLSKGSDLAFTIRPKAPATVWPDSLIDAWIAIEETPGSPATTWYGVITPTQITFKVESETVDTIKNGRLWRLVLSFDANPTYEQTIINGKVRRYDGASGV